MNFEVRPKCPGIIDDKLFSYIKTEIQPQGSKKLIAKCLLCKNEKLISGSFDSTGNFLSHLERHHSTEFQAYKKRKLLPSQGKNLKHFVTGVTQGSEKWAERLVADYVVNAMVPLSTVDNVYFRNMIKGLTKDPNLNVVTRYKLESTINQQYDELIETTRLMLSNVRYVCLTADAWTSRAKSFLGVTCHWLNNSLVRQSCVLSCTRFKGSHTYDRIANLLDSTMMKYNISLGQVVSITTDNGSNFCKAFREFGVSFDELSVEKNRNQLTIYPPEDKMSDSLEPDTQDYLSDDKEETAVLHNEWIDSILSTSRDTEKRIKLPPHNRCVSHTLSLIASKDITKVKDKGIYHKAIGKCSKLWSLSTSSKSAEKIIEACGKNFKRPVETRWNSLFDALNRLLEMKSGLDETCDNLGLARFSGKEMQFLEEFCQVSRPISTCLDELQAEKNLYMGDVLPILRQKCLDLDKLKDKSTYCGSILNAYLEGLRSRFGSLFVINTTQPSDLVLATISHPFFKLRWIECDLSPEQLDQLKKSFVREAIKYYDETQNETMKEQLTKRFDFETVTPIQSTSNIVELECYRYFNDYQTSVEMLNDANYKTIKKLFTRYNTSLPSSAPVERLFSYGGLILSSRRSSLSDEKFEKLLLLKCRNVTMK